MKSLTADCIQKADCVIDRPTVHENTKQSMGFFPVGIALCFTPSLWFIRGFMDCIECGTHIGSNAASSWCSPACRKFSLKKEQESFASKSRTKRVSKRQRQIQAKQNKLKIKTNNNQFYSSPAWLSLRYETIKKHDRKCMVCFRTNIELHVDHIKPRSKHPELSLVAENLQILCRECNLGKGNKDEIDWRTPSLI